jgi:uncharacterized protein
MMDHDSHFRKPVAPFVAYLFLFFSVWVFWVLVIYPWLLGFGDKTLAYAFLNIILRLLVWVAPVLFYLRFIDRVSPLEYLKLKQYWKRGLVFGLAYSILNFTASLLAFGVPHPAAESFTWNSIIGTSILIGFVEEIPFRGFILQKLQERMNFWAANLISSILFLLIHFPGWISLHLMTVQTVVSVFIFGFIMALLLKYSRSLWAPVVAHSLNDFLAFVIFRR